MTSEGIADLDGYEFHNGAKFEQENDDEINAEKYTTVGRLTQIKQNEMTATRMALDDVKIIDRSYLQKSFKAKSAAAQKLIEETIK